MLINGVLLLSAATFCSTFRSAPKEKVLVKGDGASYIGIAYFRQMSSQKEVFLISCATESISILSPIKSICIASALPQRGGRVGQERVLKRSKVVSRNNKTGNE